MVSSFGFSLILLVLARNGVVFSTHAALLMTVAVTTVCWLLAAYLAPQTDPDVLVAFYRKVRPFGPGWARDPRPRRCAAGRRARRARTSRWRCSAGSPAARRSGRRCSPSAISSTDAPAWRWLLTAVFAVSGLVVIRIVARLWTGGGDRPVT